MLDCAESIAATVSRNDKIFLHGPVGAGKTTLVRMILIAMGIDERISSPTYTLANSYYHYKYGDIYHLDCYRVNDERYFYDADLDVYLDGLCFIEWPDNILSHLPKPNMIITIEQTKALNRNVDVQYFS